MKLYSKRHHKKSSTSVKASVMIDNGWYEAISAPYNPLAIQEDGQLRQYVSNAYLLAQAGFDSVQIEEMMRDIADDEQILSVDFRIQPCAPVEYITVKCKVSK